MTTTMPVSSIGWSPILASTSQGFSGFSGSPSMRWSGSWTTMPPASLASPSFARRASFSRVWSTSNIAGLPSYLPSATSFRKRSTSSLGMMYPMLSAPPELAEGQADHLPLDERRAAAVAGVDRRVDLDAEAGGRAVEVGELDPRDDPLGHRQARPAGREAVDHHGLLDLRQLLGAGQGGMLVEERLVVELQDGQVDARPDIFDGGGQPRARLMGLDEDLARVGDDVCVGQDSLALDHHAGPAPLLRDLLGPGLVRVGQAHRREDLDDRVADLPLFGGRPGSRPSRRPAAGTRPRDFARTSSCPAPRSCGLGGNCVREPGVPACGRWPHDGRARGGKSIGHSNFVDGGPRRAAIRREGA